MQQRRGRRSKKRRHGAECAHLVDDQTHPAPYTMVARSRGAATDGRFARLPEDATAPDDGRPW